MVTNRTQKQQTRKYAAENNISYLQAYKQLKFETSSAPRIELIAGPTGGGKTTYLKNLYNDLSSKSKSFHPYTGEASTAPQSFNINDPKHVFIDEIHSLNEKQTLLPDYHYYITVHSYSVDQAIKRFSAELNHSEQIVKPSSYVVEKVHLIHKERISTAHTYESTVITPVKTSKCVEFVSWVGGAGKTQSTIRTAATLAAQGYSVVVLDTDLRDGQIDYILQEDVINTQPLWFHNGHKLYTKVKTTSYGFDYLSPSVKPRELDKVPYINSDILETVKELKQRYEYVLIDTSVTHIYKNHELPVDETVLVNGGDPRYFKDLLQYKRMFTKGVLLVDSSSDEQISIVRTKEMKSLQKYPHYQKGFRETPIEEITRYHKPLADQL